MKKLSLKSLNFGADDLLNRQELKTILGGYGSGSCAFQGGNGYAGISGVDSGTAQSGSAMTGGHWCCSSCCSVGWLDASHKSYLGC